MSSFSPFASMGVALAGSAILSLGMVLQKRHVGWIGAKKAAAANTKVSAAVSANATSSSADAVTAAASSVAAARHGDRTRDVLLWSLGFVLMNIQPIFVYVALLGLPANVVSAAAGASVAFTAIFSALLLGEKMSRRKVFWTAVLFISVAVAGLRGVSGSRELYDPALYGAFALPLALAVFILALGKRLPENLAVVAIAVAAGSLGGFMVLPMQGLQTLPGPGLIAWIQSPYLYVYLGAGIGSFALNQIAYRRGAMTMIAPAFYGMQVLWPAVASYAVAGAPFDALQSLAFAGIAASILLMSRK